MIPERWARIAEFLDSYFGLGHAARGFAWLESAYQERSNGVALLKAWQMLDPYRTDPRYSNLVRRIGLEP